LLDHSFHIISDDRYNDLGEPTSKVGDTMKNGSKEKEIGRRCNNAMKYPKSAKKNEELNNMSITHSRYEHSQTHQHSHELNGTIPKISPAQPNDANNQTNSISCGVVEDFDNVVSPLQL
jgi:hypothetical protein